MSLTWTLSENVFVVTVVDTYTLEDFTRAVAELRDDPQYRPGLSLLFDARTSRTHLRPDLIEGWVKIVAGLHHEAGFSRRCAIVVKERERHRFEMARVAANLIEPKGLELTVSRDFEVALAALVWPASGGPPQG